MVFPSLHAFSALFISSEVKKFTRKEDFDDLAHAAAHSLSIRKEILMCCSASPFPLSPFFHYVASCLKK